MSDLKLANLHERHPGLSPAVGESYTEAAFVCLSRHHISPVSVSVKQDGSSLVHTVDFTAPDERVRNSHANDIDATEMGAYGMSLAAVEAIDGLVAVRRAETLTGADWYIAPKGTQADDLENCIRLEVSGVNSGTSNDVRRRLVEKVAQTTRGNSNLPAMAAVVGFKVLEIAMSPIGLPK